MPDISIEYDGGTVAMKILKERFFKHQRYF